MEGSLAGAARRSGPVGNHSRLGCLTREEPASYRKCPQIDHADAAGELKEIYDDIQATLRVRWVAFACRVSRERFYSGSVPSPRMAR